MGVDWARQTHHMVLTDAKGGKVAERGFDHGSEGLAEMATWICKHAGGAGPAAIGIAIEVPRGSVVEGLMERGFTVHAINPRQLDRFRDRFSPAGTKDASRDAEVLASALRTDPRCLRRLEPLDPTVVELREWPGSPRTCGTTETGSAIASAHLANAAERLRLVNRQIGQADDHIDRLTARLAEPAGNEPGQVSERHDATILGSLPGVGRIVLAKAYEALRRRDYKALRCLSGVAPITLRSGKNLVVIMRQAVNVRMRNAVYQWARMATQHDNTSRAKYAALRARGHNHARALRSVADRLLAVACAMLEARWIFDPDRAPKAAS